MTNNTYNKRVPVIQVGPITAWNPKKARIQTNVEIDPTPETGLTKKSIADCLQTRPVDRRHRLVRTRGELPPEKLLEIDHALKVVFDLL